MSEPKDESSCEASESSSSQPRRREQPIGERSRERRQEFESRLSGAVIIDCGFPGLQTEREIVSLTQQLSYTHGCNRRAERPTRLIVAGVFAELEASLERLTGRRNWAGVEFTELEAWEAVPAGMEAVYLTADSEQVLSELEDGICYVIGGLVDRNRYNGLTAERARNCGMRTAKLPLHLYVNLSGSRILTVNQVFEILSRARDLDGDWAKAIRQTIPARKCLPEAEGATS